MNFFDLLRRKTERIKEGTWKEFNNRAVLISVGSYQNNLKHGLWKEFYPTGELMIEEVYHCGIPHGRYATYYPNGKLQSEGNFLLGSREGYFRLYSEEGQLVKSQLYINDALIEESGGYRNKVLDNIEKRDTQKSVNTTIL